MKVATDDTLFSAKHLHPIDENAYKKKTMVSWVWTGFTKAGAASGHDCKLWTSKVNDDATTGSTTAADGTWADNMLIACYSGGGQGIYCLEQIP